MLVCDFIDSVHTGLALSGRPVIEVPCAGAEALRAYDLSKPGEQLRFVDDLIADLGQIRKAVQDDGER